MTPDTRHDGRWTVGADAVRLRDRATGSRQLPVGRLHAVSAEGLIDGRSVCMAPVALLDPAGWTWPGDCDEAGDELCWICRALTA
jgi:hypothetical protein